MTIDRDKSHLFAPFATLLAEFEVRLAEVKLPFYLFEGFRSYERQAELYAQGRTVPGKIVTNAHPGFSYHFYGLAGDYVLDGMTDRPGIQWSWETRNDSRWKRMAEIARASGLDAGYFWPSLPDPPHVQRTYGLTLARARELYGRGGMALVWEEAMSNIEKAVWPVH